MPATVQIQSGRVNGTFSNTSTVRFKNADNDTGDASDPLVKPAQGGSETYSFEKVFKLNVSAPPSNSLSNLRFHRVTTTMPTGVSDWCGARPPGSFVAPSAGTLGVQKCGTAVPTSATTMSVLFQTNGTHTDIAANTAMPAQFGPFIYIQWRISSTASPGTTGSVTYRWTFDEA